MATARSPLVLTSPATARFANRWPSPRATDRPAHRPNQSTRTRLLPEDAGRRRPRRSSAARPDLEGDPRYLPADRRGTSQLAEVGLHHERAATLHGVPADGRAVRPGQDQVEVDERLSVADGNVAQPRADLHVPGGNLPVLPCLRVEVADRSLLQRADHLERAGLHSELLNRLVQAVQEFLSPLEADEGRASVAGG